MKKSIGIMLLVLVALMSFVGAAVANGDDVDDPEAAITTPMVVVDEEAGTVTIALPVDGELPPCPPEEPGGGDEPGADGAETAAGDDEEGASYGPGSCIELTIEHPSGKTHHGAVVSTVAKSLHPSMLDGMKKGEIMRWVAKTGELPEDPEGVDEGGEEPAPGDPGDVKPGDGKANKPDKPDKKDNPGNKDNPGKGNGNGRDNPGKGKGRNG